MKRSVWENKTSKQGEKRKRSFAIERRRSKITEAIAEDSELSARAPISCSTKRDKFLNKQRKIFGGEEFLFIFTSALAIGEEGAKARAEDFVTQQTTDCEGQSNCKSPTTPRYQPPSHRKRSAINSMTSASHFTAQQQQQFEELLCKATVIGSIKSLLNHRPTNRSVKQK